MKRASECTRKRKSEKLDEILLLNRKGQIVCEILNAWENIYSHENKYEREKDRE